MIKLTRPPLAPDGGSLTIPITSATINIASVASLRSPDRNHRNTDRLRTGMLIDFAGIRRKPCVANQSCFRAARHWKWPRRQGRGRLPSGL